MTANLVLVALIRQVAERQGVTPPQTALAMTGR